ncbi:uncharacterized protein [Bemisia tabaci]|uniref:uncharacterized protein n=1 Tax=Bemisia tabaci TaxID=7038 RepID=UPI003B27F6FB
MHHFRCLIPIGVFLFIFSVQKEVSASKGDYIGCFQDQEENRLLSETKERSAELTSSWCIEFCSEKGYPFAGTQYSSECYCGYNRLPLIAKRPDSECSRPCSGDSKTRCGGELRLSVYETGISALGAFPSGFHLGCFKENAEKDNRKLLPDLHQQFVNLTPKICSEFCFKNGFKLSGVQNGDDCFCTNKKLDNSDHKKILFRTGCDIPCSGDVSKKCGGAQELNVYATGLTDIPATGRTYACYEDGPDSKGQLVRALPNFRAELRKILTPRICLNMCYQMGFNWAGVEAGYECFCGVWLPSIEKTAKDTECSVPCEGGPGETCGGLWRIHVYRTPLPEPQRESDTKEYLGCYQDQKGHRLLGEVREWSAELTPGSCIDLCSKGGYAFAGLYHSSDCFCGHNRPPSLAKRPDAECSAPCSGDSKQKCGGTQNGLSVYKTGLSGIGALPSEFYLGCFSENTAKTAQRLLPEMKQEFNDLTPKVCAEFCFKKGFKLSGLQGAHCFCSSKKLDLTKKVDSKECTTNCEGDSSKKCGGSPLPVLSYLSVYATGLTDAPATGKQIACYKDGPNGENDRRLRALPDFRTALRGVSSPGICMNICYQMGFNFAGLQAGYECFCGVWQPAEVKSRPDTECNVICEGAPAEECGGHWRLQVYKTPLLGDEPEELVAYLGCYSDQENDRLLGDFKEASPTMSPTFCSDLCSKGGYPFAGLHYSTECFCGHNRPPLAVKRPDQECSLPCSGSNNQKCGDKNKLSIYQTRVPGIGSVPKGFYVGCFAENPFPDLQQSFKELTPQRCSEFCFKRGFKLSGVQGKNCFCTNSKLDLKKKVKDKECSTSCEADSSKKCGAKGRINVYTTGLTDSPATGRLVGCFEDEPTKSGQLQRALPNFRSDLRETNSPRTCLNICYQMGFRFAGLQDGYECFCGKWQPAQEKRKSDAECNTQCSGDPSEKCGGNWRLQVYRTPLADEGAVTLGPSTTRGTTHPSTTKKTPSQQQKVTTTPSPTSNCQLSATVVNGKRACKNSVVFYDDFRKFDGTRWSHEVKVADKPDYEFTVYNSKAENTYMRNGALHIQPTIFDDNFVESGSIHLERCTGEVINDECTRNTDYFILPPTQSARINTRQKFSFKYGVVEVQARLPVGDWIVAEMALIPSDNSYGPYYESGKIRIISRGNLNLQYDDGREMGSQTVEGSVMLGYGTSVKAKKAYFSEKSGWRNVFHNFTMIWTPDDIAFMVDGRRKQNMMVNAHGSRLSDVLGFSNSEIKLWNTGTTIAPFDQSFYLSLGLYVGGVRDFDEGASSNGYIKPWSNTDPRAMLTFWNRRNEWQRTWEGDSTFVIKSIKVTQIWLSQALSAPNGENGTSIKSPKKENRGLLALKTGLDAERTSLALGTVVSLLDPLNVAHKPVLKPSPPNSPPPLGIGIATYQPSGPISQGTYQPVGPANQATYQPSGPINQGTYQPSGPANQATYQPSGPINQGTYQPSGPINQGTYQPSGPINQETYQPSGPINQGTYQPSAPAQGTYQPSGSANQGTYQPSSPVDQGTYQPPSSVNQGYQPPGSVNQETYQPVAPINNNQETGRPSAQLNQETTGAGSQTNCPVSTTIVNGHRTCKNSVVFYDDFRKFDTDFWSHEVKVANKPDYEFTVYDSKPENTFYRNGVLHIQPTIFDDNFVENGHIQLERCTGEVVNNECSRNTDYFILPPVQSARISTRQKFSFKYGILEVQARLPIGDWIVSEIALLPADHTYGTYYDSGKIRMMSRGNRHLKYDDGREMGSQTVEGSVMLGYGTRVKSKPVYFTDRNGWRNELHNFTIIWTPDDIAFMVDGRKKQNVMVNAHGSRLSDVVGFPSSEIKLWNAGTSIAPFDQPFYVSLGLYVGGVRDFEEGASSNGYSKPWSNTDPRAMLSFWNKRNEWQRTWQGDSSFVIQSVKITAL